MNNKETLNTYNERLGANNTSLESILETINNLPEAGSGELNLQDKTIEITENGTTNIVADEGYDGLNSVEVITNVSSGETPEKGFIVTEWDDEGYALAMQACGMTEIPQYAFGIYNTSLTKYGALYNLRLKKVILPEGVTKIGYAAFYGMSNIERVELPNTLTELSREMCRGCTKLKNIKTIPDGITVLPENVFFTCKSLTQLSMKNVTQIVGISMTACSFRGDNSLKAVWIGSAITSSGFGAYAFCECSSIKKMFIDLPRATVETFTHYKYAWSRTNSGQTLTTSVIVCNDDEGFMSKEEFDAIDWATYIG